MLSIIAVKLLYIVMENANVTEEGVLQNLFPTKRAEGSILMVPIPNECRESRVRCPAPRVCTL